MRDPIRLRRSPPHSTIRLQRIGSRLHYAYPYYFCIHITEIRVLKTKINFFDIFNRERHIIKKCELSMNPLLSLKNIAFVLTLIGMILLVFPFAISQNSRQETESHLAYKRFVDGIISPQKIDRYLRRFTEIPHVASSPRNNELAQFILKEWKSYGLENVHHVHYDVLLSFPRKILVEMISPKKYRLKLKEASYKEDPDTSRSDVGIPYNAYSRSGVVTAPLVYAHGGNPEDYEFLEKRGIDLKGKIALVRYSSPYSYRGFKAYTAEKRGLAALLIYSDPMEDGFSRGPVFPDGPWGPMSHIQRGGIPYDFIYPGDPLTPGWASVPHCKRISLEEARTLPEIISVPISAQDARPLLESMGGEEAPEEWKGALPVTYRLGGAEAQVRVDVQIETSIKRITNVIGYLIGSTDQEGFVLVGNHRDAWVFGGYDPSSGTACLMELVRVLAEARKKDFQPKRTICFASWDAEEFTLTGSTEWGEENREKLRRDLIAYLNVDSAASGKKFSVQAVPCLSPMIIRALKEVKDPLSQKSVYERWREGTGEKGAIVIAGGSGKINPIGSGTDHTVFLNHIGVPALDMTFSGDYGVYHSMYDNYYWMSHFGDPGMLYTAALARIWAHMVIDLVNKSLLPLDYECYAQRLKNYLDEWAKRFDFSKKKSRTLFDLISKMEKKASFVTSYLLGTEAWKESQDSSKIHEINRLLIEIERDFILPRGIPHRPWFKHLIFGARYTYAVLLLPALTEAAEAGDEEGVRRSLRDLEEAIKNAVIKLDKISEILRIEKE